MAGERELARGSGKSKQLAELAAAEAALAQYDALDRDDPIMTDAEDEDETD
jgi:dsRNA-specific ribonuclease